MAEIHIERKRPPLWPWLVTALAVAFVVWYWAAADNRETSITSVAQGDGVVENEPTPDQAARASATGAGAVDEYLQFARVGRASAAPDIGPGHDYTAEGMRKLAGALEALTEGRDDTQAHENLGRLRELAGRLQDDRNSNEHAGFVRDGFRTATNVIASLERAQSTNELRSIAESIDPQQPLLDQQERVRQFFEEAAPAIAAVSGG